MKKRIIAIATVLMMAAAPVMAQVFIDDEDGNNRFGEKDLSMDVPNPQIYNSGEDWYLPIGEGVFVLAGLAGAYLLKKRKNEE